MNTFVLILRKAEEEENKKKVNTWWEDWWAVKHPAEWQHVLQTLERENRQIPGGRPTEREALINIRNWSNRARKMRRQFET